MMKNVFILVVLCVFTASAAELKNALSRANLQLGWPAVGDWLLERTYVQKYGIANAVQYQEYHYIGNVTTRISAVLATEVGDTQYGTVLVSRGGIGWNNVSLTIKSVVDKGFYYLLDVWGR